jgi:16S rRNA (guanine527-N7)-methyltransferase
VPQTDRRRGRRQTSFGSGWLSGHEQPRPTPPPLRHSPLPDSAADLVALDAAFWQAVDDGLDALSIVLTAGARAAIEDHVRLLLAWNEAINLTALRSVEQMARRHVLDSLSASGACWRLLERSGGPVSEAALLDLGSGAGYPGLPLALALRVARVALVDSVQKKAGFLRVAGNAVAAAMGRHDEPVPQIDVYAERAEDLADRPDQRERWDLVVARALGSLAEVAELGLPLSAIGGHVVAWKRNDGDGLLELELAAARPVVQAAGGSRPRIERADPSGALGLPGHVLVIIRKSRPTPDRYPRPAAERKRAALLR